MKNLKMYLSKLNRIRLFSFAVFLLFLFLGSSTAIASVTIISPTAYTVADLNVGDEYYLDRTYTLTSIPSELSTGAEEWIKTQNNDKSNTEPSNFLQFTISQDSTVYVAYDSRAPALPAWLSANFTPTSPPLTIGVTDSLMGYFEVYQSTFPAGTVSLGGNFAVPASIAGSNYIVIVKPAGSVAEICDNGLDDDLDSLIDCDDPDCSTNPVCGVVEICDNGLDDDLDSLIDCADPDCSADPVCSGGGVTIISPTAYTVADLNVGDEYYLDRTYTLTSIPSELSTGAEEWIKTQNNDKSNTEPSNFLQFTISQDSTVYVAYDSRAPALPAWLSANFTPTSPPLTIGVTDSLMGYFDVYQSTFPAGTVSLGGNFAVPASIAGSNYIVIVKPAGSVAEICDNGLDDDLDSLIDCDDPDCFGNPVCGVSEICDNGLDDDLDSLIDCDDPDCSTNPVCGVSEICDNGLDDDLDSLIDCDDPDCSTNPVCGVSEICDNGLDDDLDSLIDCNDPDCSANPACSGGNVTVISPLAYTVADLNVGDEYYLDRTYTLTSIPSELATGAEEWIKTQNNDKSNTASSDFLQFTVSQDSTVYVAYAPRATALPAWLSTNFTLTSLTIDVSDSYMGYFEVYQSNSTFIAGTVSLGGNLAVPASGVGSNYIVIVKPAIPEIEICDNGLDDDLDLLVDCDDPDCFGDPACVVEICDNGSDDDGDSLVDCADPDCSANPVCGGGTELFSDNFNDGAANGWIPVSDGGAAPNWQVVDGEYQQDNSVSILTESYHKGTFSYLPNWFSLTDYQMSVKIIIDPSSDGKDVGIMFRYLSPDDYYRVSINSKYGYTRLEKKVNGEFVSLASNARGYEKGPLFSDLAFNLMVKVISNKIIVYLNGDSLFAVSDDDLPSGTVALYCENFTKFDDVSITTIESSPEIFISEPISYSVNVSSSLDVSAYVNNAPEGSSVEFLIYDEQTGTLVDQKTGVEFSSGYFTGQFTMLPTANYRVEAILLDNSNIEVSWDTNVKIGIQGEFSITLGDSIFNGTGDNFWFDNKSADERIIAFSGFQAKYSDLLTANLSYPNILFNEAVPADTTFRALTRIDSIKQRYPGANRAILLLGTNDSGGMPPLMPGSGCTSDCSGTYKGNMIQLRDTILAEPGIVDRLTVALVPPAFGPSVTGEPFPDPLDPDVLRTQIIQDYNDVILNELSNIEIGPDLFGFFIDKFSLFEDNYHPNALGNLVMSYLFFDPTENTLPFLLQNLSPSNPADYPSTYKQNLLAEGNKYYIDRSYTLTSIPSVLTGGIWIMTANDDKIVQSTSHLSFELDRQAKVYVAFDSRATSYPDWLFDNNFELTSNTIGVSDQMGYFNVFEQTTSFTSFPVTITLGGNSAPGSSGAGSNYIVIVVEQ